MKLNKLIFWPNETPPIDIPYCGFKGEFCLEDYSATYISVGIFGIILVVLSIIILMSYRNYKYEQDLDSLLWKIEHSDLHVSIFETNISVAHYFF